MGCCQSGAIYPEAATASSPDVASIASLPEEVRFLAVEAIASALHPVFYGAALASAIAFILTFFLEERTLATTLRPQDSAASLNTESV